MAKSPELIFKYQGIDEYSVLNLKAQALYFNSPKNLNDPYDGSLNAFPLFPHKARIERIRQHYVNNQSVPEHLRREFKYLTDQAIADSVIRNANQVMEQKTREYNESMGVSCFSEVKDNLLMWGHYADKYRGFCLGFRTGIHPFEKVKKIKYSRDLPTFDVVDILVNGNFDDALDALFYTKSKSWSYEREWRAVHSTSGTQYVYNHEALDSVYFGPRIGTTERAEICEIVQEQNLEVRFFQGKKSPVEFKLEFEQFECPPSGTKSA